MVMLQMTLLSTKHQTIGNNNELKTLKGLSAEQTLG